MRDYRQPLGLQKATPYVSGSARRPASVIVSQVTASGGDGQQAGRGARLNKHITSIRYSEVELASSWMSRIS
jgi:hypothetical protein